jgi:hypothetical protein
LNRGWDILQQRRRPEHAIDDIGRSQFAASAGDLSNKCWLYRSLAVLRRSGESHGDHDRLRQSVVAN